MRATFCIAVLANLFFLAIAADAQIIAVLPDASDIGDANVSASPALGGDVPVDPISNVERLDLSGLSSACDSCDGESSCGCCKSGCCKSCTCKQKKAAQKKAAGAYKGLFYDNDFSYPCDPCYTGCLLGDRLKRVPVGCCGVIDFGGQYRARYHHETGMKGQRFLATTDDFLLSRVRLFANYQMNSNFRFYVETLFADSAFEGNGVRPIDQNNMDFLNFIMDVKLTDNLTARIGRQELLYGAQRTVSPLDWANTRRTFEGIRLLYKRGDLAVDGFFTHFVPVNPTRLDAGDYQQPFYGLYAVYSGVRNATADFYYLGRDNSGTGQSLHTIGGRLNGNRGDWLYEVESAVQFGSRATGVDHGAEGFVTAGLGKKLSCHCWSPTIWFYYDYASENYNQLFPLAHKFLGFIDAVQRQNIESPNVLLTMKPSKRTNLLFWFYHFQSNTAAAVPSIGGAHPQNTRRYLGNELDVIFKYTINPRSDILFGYSHFWRGNKINNPQDADFIYTQYQINF